MAMAKTFTKSLNQNLLNLFTSFPIKDPKFYQVRGFKRWYVPVRRVLKQRRDKVGPEPPRHRSVWNNWNYNAELYAFGKRLHEEFNDATLRQAFTHRSYVEKEAEKAELGTQTEDGSLNLEHNSELIEAGEGIMTNYITSYLRNSYPLFPNEGINVVTDYLMDEKLIAMVASNIGIADLMLCTDFPPETSTLANTFKAIVGAIEKDRGLDKAEIFVEDFILTELIGKDINELWEIPAPTELLKSILNKNGQPEPEPRLLRETGRNTLFSVYVVGLYINTELFSEGAGESVPIAVEMAARDGLRRVFKTTDTHCPLPFGLQGRRSKLHEEQESRSY